MKREFHWAPATEKYYWITDSLSRSMLGDEHLENPVEALAGHRQRLGAAAGFDFPVHPHTLRQACGYKLANDGVDTRSLQA
jgi:hypothetical protein